MSASLLSRIIASNFYVAIPISGLYFTTHILGNIPIYPAYFWFVFFSTLFLYPAHRLIGLYKTTPQFYSETQKIARPIVVFMIPFIGISIIGSLYFFFLLPTLHQFYLLPFGFVAFFYSFPLFKYRSKWYRLRDIPGIKIFLICTVVTGLTVTLPLVFSEAPVRVTLLTSLAQFFYILAITIPFDIRDIQIDSLSKLYTIPLIIGRTSALLIALFALVAGWIFFAPLAQSGWVSVPILLAYTANTLATSYFILKYNRNSNPVFLALLVEGSLVMQAFLVGVTFYFFS